jgi:paired mesoderm homeobox protein 2
VWFQNRRAKFRKQERLAQQKVSNSTGSSNGEGLNHVKSESKASSKDIKAPGSPLSNVSTTPNSSASSHQSNSDIKPINGN